MAVPTDVSEKQCLHLLSRLFVCVLGLRGTPTRISRSVGTLFVLLSLEFFFTGDVAVELQQGLVFDID